MERWADIDFSKKTFYMSLNSAPTKYVSGSINFQRGDGIFYDRENPYLGHRRFFQGQITIRPNAQLREELSFAKSTFWRKKNGKEEYDYNILRSKTTYQFTKKFFIRSILEYNAYWKELTTDILLSYMYNYGTVLFFGYGGIFDRDNKMHFRQNQRSFFIKFSYLWRL